MRLNASLEARRASGVRVAEEVVEHVADVSLVACYLEHLADSSGEEVVDVPAPDAAAARDDPASQLAAAGHGRQLAEEPLEKPLVVRGPEAHVLGHDPEVVDEVLRAQRASFDTGRLLRAQDSSERCPRGRVDPGEDRARDAGGAEPLPSSPVAACELQRAEDADPTHAGEVERVSADAFPDA